MYYLYCISNLAVLLMQQYFFWNILHVNFESSWVSRKSSFCLPGLRLKYLSYVQHYRQYWIQNTVVCCKPVSFVFVTTLEWWQWIIRHKCCNTVKRYDTLQKSENTVHRNKRTIKVHLISAFDKSTLYQNPSDNILSQHRTIIGWVVWWFGCNEPLHSNESL